MSIFHNWDDTIDLNVLLQKYSAIENVQTERPVVLELEEPPKKEFVENGKQRIFTPSLQTQRNSFMYSALREISKETKVKKIAILGCGELSFEKYTMDRISDAEVEHIVSIDLDEPSLGKGIASMDQCLYELEDTIERRNALPVHLEVFKGDITLPCSLLSNVDIACSTEVIEHMPLEKASELLRVVLDTIRPKAYILSTPNHEYNTVWGMPGQFRHDDHHFEFNRAEFKRWLTENVHSPYTYEIHYVGNLLDYADLEGATQFAVIRRDGEETGSRIDDGDTYEKVGDFVYRNSYRRLFEAVVVGAFRAFIDAQSFDEATLEDCGSLKLWRFKLSDILEHRSKPTIEIDEDNAMLTLTLLFPTVCFRSLDRETNRAAISISSTSTKDYVLKLIDKLFQS